MVWTKSGPENTEATIELALSRAAQLGIDYMVVASCSGDTARKILLKKPGPNIVCVTHHVGFEGPGQDEMEQSTREYLHRQGVRVLTTTHLLAGVDRAIRKQFNGLYPAEIIAQTLRMFGQGVKVAVEVAVMALDAGLVPFGQDIISIGGTVEGADAALVIRPAHSDRFFTTQIREIICMPGMK
jgi:hypothetical protein